MIMMKKDTLRKFPANHHKVQDIHFLLIASIPVADIMEQREVQAVAEKQIFLRKQKVTPGIQKEEEEVVEMKVEAER